MKRFVVICLFLSCSNLFGQSITKPKGFTLDLGGGATLHNVFNNISLDNGSSAFATLLHFNIRYKDGVLGYGLKMEHLKFATEEDSAFVFKNAIANLLQYNTTVTLLEKNKFSFYIAAGVGVNALSYEQRDSSGVYGKIKMQGFSGSLFTGVNFHFTKRIGVFAQAGYISNVDKLTDFRVNGNLIESFQNRDLEDVVYNLRGMDFKTGLRFAF